MQMYRTIIREGSRGGGGLMNRETDWRMCTAM